MGNQEVIEIKYSKTVDKKGLYFSGYFNDLLNPLIWLQRIGFCQLFNILTTAVIILTFIKFQ